jgi:glutathione synthase/RimK-type ligase-like ATP-grasp enzyme
MPTQRVHPNNLMKRVGFIAASSGVPSNDNLDRLSHAHAAKGWDVECLTHESVSLNADGVCAASANGNYHVLESFDRVWIVGFGVREGFLDRMQMLKTLAPMTFVNTPDALVMLHGKFAFADLQPETHASSSVDELMSILATGGDWIAKPTAASFGRDVFRLRTDDPDSRAVLENLTGHGVGQYCVLQRYAPAAESNEKRVIVAGGKIIGAYGKVGGNVKAGARVRSEMLEAKEERLIERMLDYLTAQGVRFAGIDIAYPHVFEANVANPGGLKTLEVLSGIDHAPNVVDALFQYFSASH